MKQSWSYEVVFVESIGMRWLNCFHVIVKEVNVYNDWDVKTNDLFVVGRILFVDLYLDHHDRHDL